MVAPRNISDWEINGSFPLVVFLKVFYAHLTKILKKIDQYCIV